jgi:hypothetical protein
MERIIKRVDADLASAEAVLRAAQGRVVEAQSRVDQLLRVREGLSFAVEHYGAPPSTVDASPSVPVGKDAGTDTHPWLRLSQMDACLAALADFGRPASTSEIHKKLVQAGRPEKPEQVRNAVGYLFRRAKRINRVGRGLWELPPGADITPTVHVVDVVEDMIVAGENETSAQAGVLTGNGAR